MSGSKPIMSPVPSLQAQTQRHASCVCVLWHHKRWGICCRPEALSNSEEILCCIHWLFSLNNSVWSVILESPKLNYVELHWIVVDSLCYSRVSTLTKMAFAADCGRLLLTDYWHQHNMQLMTATPHSDTSCTEEKDPSHIAAKNVSDVINRINRNSSPRWVQYCLFA
jgi:hypothetical protein